MAPPGYGHYSPFPAPVAQPPPPAEEKKEAKKEKKAKSPKPASPIKWQGRTKAEVEEDDMKVAAREGAYAERQVEPIGLDADQVVWVVDTDGGNELR